VTIARDDERTAVYAAESVAFDGTDLETPRPLGELQDLVARVAASAWWPGPAVTVIAARRDAASSSARDCGTGGAATVRIAAGQCTVATAAHELAHCLAGVPAGHGPTFRAAMLDVVTVATNLDPTDRRGGLHRDQLLVAFDDAGLVVGERAWPPPPDEIAGAIALG
jgi:hypothetical protein